VNIRFILGFLESWDSIDGTVAPDNLKIEVDGTPVLFDLTSNNASGSTVNDGGGTALAQNVQANGTIYFSDTLIDMATSPALLSIPHSASTLSLAIHAYGAGWQAGNDEAWGIDALSITYEPAVQPNAVPGPLPMLGAASALRFSRKIRRSLALAGRGRLEAREVR
jgi:hypothetical protein